MSLFDDDIGSDQDIYAIYLKTERWLIEHCGKDVLYTEASPTYFISPLIDPSVRWDQYDGRSTKVKIEPKDGKMMSIIPTDRNYYLYIADDDMIPDYIDLTGVDCVYVDPLSNDRIIRDPNTHEIVHIYKSHAVDRQ